jgi:hypothetical protein
MKKLITTLLSLSALGLPATEIDDLVTDSQSIVNSIDNGIMAVGGLNHYAWIGGIAPDGTVDSGYISTEQMDAYNTSLSVVSAMTYYDASAYLDEMANAAIDNMNTAIDSFVQATMVIVTVLAVNEMAETAQSTGDVKDAQALQDFMGGNDVELTQAEIDSYNSSLTDVEGYAQDAAAYFATASNDDFVSELNSASDQYGNSFVSAQSTFDSATGYLTVEWANASVSIDLNAYYKSIEDIYTEGETSTFYQTSPMVCGWDFSLCDEEA